MTLWYLLRVGSLTLWRILSYGHTNIFVKIRRESRVMLKLKHNVIYAIKINVDGFITKALFGKERF